MKLFLHPDYRLYAIAARTKSKRVDSSECPKSIDAIAISAEQGSSQELESRAWEDQGVQGLVVRYLLMRQAFVFQTAVDEAGQALVADRDEQEMSKSR